MLLITVTSLSNGAIFNDLESRTGHSLMLNISEMAKDRPTAIATMEDEYETVPNRSNGTIFNNLE